MMHKTWWSYRTSYADYHVWFPLHIDRVALDIEPMGGTVETVILPQHWHVVCMGES